MATASAFQALIAAAPPPAQKVVTLPLSAWAPSFGDKPEGPMPVGLCTPSQAELEAARAEAARKAWRMHPADGDDEDRLDARNGVLMTLVVARGTCQPDDLREPFFRGDVGADDMVPAAWTAATIEHLFEHLNLLQIEQSPIAPGATDAELHVLAAALQDGSAWAAVDLAAAQRARRVLRYALDILNLTTE